MNRDTFRTVAQAGVITLKASAFLALSASVSWASTLCDCQTIDTSQTKWEAFEDAGPAAQSHSIQPGTTCCVILHDTDKAFCGTFDGVGFPQGFGPVRNTNICGYKIK